jgi:hypothetical protein
MRHAPMFEVRHQHRVARPWPPMSIAVQSGWNEFGMVQVIGHLLIGVQAAFKMIGGYYSMQKQ